MANDTALTAAQAAGIDALKGLTSWNIAEMANSADENDEAHAFWNSIRDGVVEAIEYAEGEEPDDDALAEVADGAPDVYNYTRMMELVGTRCYLDSSELASGSEDILTLAGYVLYEAARTAADGLVRLYVETRDDEEAAL